MIAGLLAQPDDGWARRIDDVLSDNFRWLRFPEDLEARFVHDTNDARARHHARMMTIALILYDLFLIGDWQLIPDIFLLCAVVRLAILTPLALLFYALIRRGVRHEVREMVVVVSTWLSGGSLLLFMSLTKSPLAAHYYMGLPLVAIYGNTVQRIRFWYATGGSAVLFVLVLLVLWDTTSLKPQVAESFAMVLLGASVFTLAALYKLEHDERRTYLLQLREQGLRVRLGRAYQQLHELSRTDTVTGIPNCRYFEERFAETWRECRGRGLNVALLMVDVDHFKQYNDRYGHPAGDQCLRRIAAAIQTALRNPEDFVARYGGEEFVAVLPNACDSVAEAIAERVRNSVIAADLIHESSPSAAIVTVSVGAASIDPRDRGSSPGQLVKAADRALYEAKAAGRNLAVLRALEVELSGADDGMLV